MTQMTNQPTLDRAYDGIIIGAGHHGLVLGGYLARQGLDILLLERRLDYGGGLCTRKATGCWSCCSWICIEFCFC